MTIQRISLIHPTSNPFSRNAAIAFAEAGWLHEVITTTAYNPTGALANAIRTLPTSIQTPLTQELERRTWVAPDGAVMRSHPWREILRVALVKSRLSQRLKLGRQGPIDWVYASLDHHVARHHLHNLDAIYAYEDGAATTFQVAKQRGIACLYDLPIPFYQTSRRIQQNEADQFPELASALQAIDEPTWKIERKVQEIELADHIFVASSMTKRSLLEASISPDKISVIPYGAPIDYFHPRLAPPPTFRALFVGRVGPRKGVHYLLQAWQALNLPQAALQLVGINEFSERWFAQYQSLVDYVPSVPHQQLGDYYRAANVFVFPSLVEGFGLVLLEAMACGLPIITTPNTAGPDIITDGVEGFIIPIRDIDALQAKLEWCYRHPHELAEMGLAARRKAEQLTWSQYRQSLTHHVKTLLQTADPLLTP